MSDLRPNSEISDGIHWLKDKYVNNYIIENGEDLFLIDTALGKKANGILGYVQNELESRTIAKIYLTHHHLDHTGGLHTLYESFHPNIFVSEIDSAFVKGEKKAPLPNSMILKPLFFIMMSLMRPKPVTNVAYIEDNEKLDGFIVHHLPGHTLGSMGFSRHKVIFSGDAATTTKNGEVSLGPRIVTESKELARKSLKKLGTMQLDLLLPGHGPPILEDATQRVLNAIEKYGE